MFRKIMTSALLGAVCCASVARAAEPSDYIVPGREQMFDGTLSGLRAAHEIFEDGRNDSACPDCSTDRELKFLHALTSAAILVIRDDGGSINSVFEMAEQFGVEVIGNYWSGYLDPCDLPFRAARNRHGAYEIPKTAPDVNEMRNFIDISMIPEIEAIIADLDAISDSPDDRFRIFLDPDETLVFFGPNSLKLQYDLEVDYGEVMILKALLTGLKAQLQAQSAYDMHVDANSMLMEKMYGHSFGANDDLLDPHPEFLKVLPTANDPFTDGAALLAQARQDWIDTIDYYFETLAYITSEDDPPGTDPQDDEFLYINPNARLDLERIEDFLTTLRGSLENDTAGTYPAKTTKTYDIYDAGAALIGQLVVVYDSGIPLGMGGSLDIDGDTGSLTLFTDPNVAPIQWQAEWHGRDEDWIEVDLERYSDGRWSGAYFEGALSYDGNNITNATFEYWGSNSNIGGLFRVHLMIYQDSSSTA